MVVLAALAVGCPDWPRDTFRVPWPDAGAVGFDKADVWVLSGQGLWKNGRWGGLYSKTPAGVVDWGAHSLFVSNGSAYVAMHEAENRFIEQYGSWMQQRFAVVWKDGATERVGADCTQALSVFAADGRVYAAGCKDNYPANDGGAMLWVDGEAARLGAVGADARANSVFVSPNGGVYVAGRENGAATLWVNGRGERLADGGRESEALSVYVDGRDVYVAGRTGPIGDGLTDTRAALWVNGEPMQLGDGGHASANQVVVSGGDVYVAGMHQRRPALWKNGAAQRLGDQLEYYGRAGSVSVLGGDVYVAGEMHNLPVLWKNGAAYSLGDSAQPLSVSAAAK
jgi:hypothetical protein